MLIRSHISLHCSLSGHITKYQLQVPLCHYQLRLDSWAHATLYKLNFHSLPWEKEFILSGHMEPFSFGLCPSPWPTSCCVWYAVPFALPPCSIELCYDPHGHIVLHYCGIKMSFCKLIWLLSNSRPLSQARFTDNPAFHLHLFWDGGSS